MQQGDEIDNEEKIENHLKYLRSKIPYEDTYEFISKLMWSMKLICEVGLKSALEEEFVLHTCKKVLALIGNENRYY